MTALCGAGTAACPCSQPYGRRHGSRGLGPCAIRLAWTGSLAAHHQDAVANDDQPLSLAGDGERIGGAVQGLGGETVRLWFAFTPGGSAGALLAHAAVSERVSKSAPLAGDRWRGAPISTLRSCDDLGGELGDSEAFALVEATAAAAPDL